MALPARRLAAVAALAFVAVLAVDAAESDHYLPIDDGRQRCWSCHSNWNPPIPAGQGGRYAIAMIIPPPAAGAEPGKAFDYKVQIQNTWLADVTFMAPSIDLTNAPTLRFAGGHAPETSTTTIAITPNATEPTTPQGASTLVNVTAGATALQFTIHPHTTDTTNGPNVALRVWAPGGVALPGTDEKGRGLDETRVITPAELAQYGGGLWRVGARFTPVDPAGGPPVFLRQDIDVIEAATFETAGLRIQAFPRAEFLGPAASTLQTWGLSSAPTPPAPGETVRLRLNITGHYLHVPPVGVDWGNFTSYVDADVVSVEGKTMIVFKAEGVVGPAILNGATATTISEAVGYAAAFLLISSIASGGMLGRASRRGLNHVFGSAKRRVAFHNFLSYGLTVAALVHMCIFVLQKVIPAPWTSSEYNPLWGVTFGGIAILSMVGLGITGALQVPMIRRWNYGTWRWTHYGMTVAALLFTLVHMAFDGKNDPIFHLQNLTGWKNQVFPFDTP
ncbi:MAG: ferric reductase-like transmembrane domain-containing protein [bacterium]